MRALKTGTDSKPKIPVAKTSFPRGAKAWMSLSFCSATWRNGGGVRGSEVVGSNEMSDGVDISKGAYIGGHLFVVWVYIAGYIYLKARRGVTMASAGS